MRVFAVVLAAGQGTRMKSEKHKVLHSICGKPLLGHVVDALEQLKVDRTVVVIGHQAEAVREALGERAEYAVQPEQRGTGHAVLQAKALLGGESGNTIIMYGDTPLLTVGALQDLLRSHSDTGAKATILTARLDRPDGYGRIVRDGEGRVSAIVEHKDCSPEQLRIHEVNTGTYCIDNQTLFQALEQVGNDNAQHEYYLTDVIGIIQKRHQHVESFCLADASEALGINDRVELARAEQTMRERILREHMLQGVTIIDPAHTYIDAGVRIGRDTTVHPGTFLRGRTTVGAHCVIGPNTEITGSQIGDHATVRQSVLEDAKVAESAAVGPFAYLRPGADIGKKVKIGDFVEVKNARIGEGSKVSHLSYVGDARVGQHVNIGCGAITVNYDGVNKHLTEIGDDAFVGSNVNLIAPVRIGRGAYVVAGSTITRNVDDNDLAIARERQTNKPGYASEMRRRFGAKKK